VAASFGCVYAPNAGVLIAARLLQSLGGCASMVIGRAVVRDRFDHQESARFLSLMTLVSGLAPILGPLIGSGLLSVMGWRSIFAVLAGFGVVVTLAVALWLPESRSEATASQARQEHPFRSYWRLMRHMRFLGYLLGAALNSACIFAYIASSPSVLIGVYGLSPTLFSLTFGLNSIGLVAGAQLNRWLLVRHGADQVLAFGAVVSVGFGLWLALATVTGLGGLWGLLVPLFLTVTSAGMIQINTTAGGLNVDPLRAGSSSALFGSASFGLGAGTASLAGLLADGTARPMAIVIAACLGLSAAALLALALRPRLTPA
jgi:DHA1 family bicyclomycin/chloramphenicol resistance-like MFS transporter